MSVCVFDEVRAELSNAVNNCKPELTDYAKKALKVIIKAKRAFFKAFEEFGSLEEELKEQNILLRDLLKNAVQSILKKCNLYKELSLDPEDADFELIKKYPLEIIISGLQLGYYINDDESIKAYNELIN